MVVRVAVTTEQKARSCYRWLVRAAVLLGIAILPCPTWWATPYPQIWSGRIAIPLPASLPIDRVAAESGLNG